MKSPFPGMDPYLERASLWADVHHRLISSVADSLAPGLRPKYYVAIEERVYISTPDDPGRDVIVPDIAMLQPRRPAQVPQTQVQATITPPLVLEDWLEPEIRQSYLEIRLAGEGHVITVLEILSPANKVSGAQGRASFLQKRAKVLASQTHWLEVDLLRQGARQLPAPVAQSDYYALLGRARPASGQPHRLEFWPIPLRQPLPTIAVPLMSPDPDAPLDLQAALDLAYRRAGYDLLIDYGQEPQPPLKPQDARWADRLLRRAGLR